MQQEKSSTSVVELEEPACVKKVPRKVPENQSSGWRPPFLGSAPFRFSGGVPRSFASGSVRLDRGPLCCTQPRLRLVSQRESGVRSDAAPCLLSPSVPPLRRLGTVWLPTLSICSSSIEAFAHVVDDSAPLSPDRQELERGTRSRRTQHVRNR